MNVDELEPGRELDALVVMHKVHVWVCGTYAGAYEFETREEAEADLKWRKDFEVLGCYYEIESPLLSVQPA